LLLHNVYGVFIVTILLLKNMLIAALILGFAGSLHCVAMCAPITLALSMQGKTRGNFIVGKLLYNTGRILTYTALGAALGASKELLGTMLFDIHGVQEVLSISLGVGIFVVVLIPQHIRTKIFGMPVFVRVLGRLRGRIGGFMRSSRMSGQFALGLLNGLLPCGFVYMGLAMAALSGSTGDAALTMLSFGLGTFPAMFGIAMLARIAGVQMRFTSSLRRYAPFGAALVAVLFLIRGLALGIPYLSPKLSAQPAGTEQGCAVPR
jgi:uncharacterized protein